jgi:hypothetical protein
LATATTRAASSGSACTSLASWSSEQSGSSSVRCTRSAISVVVGKIRSSAAAVCPIWVSIAFSMK